MSCRAQRWPTAGDGPFRTSCAQPACDVSGDVAAVAAVAAHRRTAAIPSTSQRSIAGAPQRHMHPTVLVEEP